MTSLFEDSHDLITSDEKAHEDSLPEQDHRSLVFFDTETTGQVLWKLPMNHPDQPSIVQLAAIMTDHNGAIKATMNCLIKPSEIYPFAISAEAQNIHGITQRDCERYGVPIGGALRTFHLMLLAGPCIAIAHNYLFDQKMNAIECSRLQCKDPLSPMTAERADASAYCTMQKSTDVCRIPSNRGFKWPRLEEAYEFLTNQPIQNAHDALGDVKTCMEVYFALRDRGL